MDTVSRQSFHFRLPDYVTTMRESQRLRLATLVRLRWLSVVGQIATVVFVAWGVWWPIPAWYCLALIALSVGLNIYLSTRFPASHRLSTGAAAGVLTFDILQPTGLLFLTGGLNNPFAIFLIVPTLIASATQPPATTFGLGLLASLAATFLAVFHLPLPWPEGEMFQLPAVYLAGLWYAIVGTLCFSAVYVYRVAAESRALADALSATELVLQREQHISALDGLAAAAAHELGTPLATIALATKEMSRAVGKDDPLREDIDLLLEQSERCREILRRLSTLSSSSESHMAKLPLLSLIEQVAEPHREFGVDLHVETRGEGAEPVTRRNAGVLYGLGNIVENAVDFAAGNVVIEVFWNADRVKVTVRDDGPGFNPDVLDRIGDPYMSERFNGDRRAGGGLGLGVFIAKTLLERSGAVVTFENTRERGKAGAVVSVEWNREVLETGTSLARSVEAD
ncbi:sensor histidine kinase [Fulvimarina endophytica]|uniref:histidine kinase n=1 Tax=Fulvimarina endophytica TaxID=2293836 RepID=A0A371X8A4_9HYPH|nr:ActS/PrrB/RegB family redox-sensitive histidine kinase [Fulvimarina endophytica]RFC65438.1 sensor histidine kinase [Fulvimarina endophytica]